MIFDQNKPKLAIWDGFRQLFSNFEPFSSISKKFLKIFCSRLVTFPPYDHDNDADDDNYIPIPNIENIKNTKIHEQGLGFAKYLIPHQRECRDKWMDITNTRQPFFNLKNIFCGFTIQNSIEEKSSIKPVCGSDNGGSLLINIKLHELKDKVNLYENTVQALRGMTIWSDVDCENDINGFLDVQVYLSWMKEVLGEELFGEINRQIVPSQHNVEVFETYKGVIFDWRQGLDEK